MSSDPWRPLQPLPRPFPPEDIRPAINGGYQTFVPRPRPRRQKIWLHVLLFVLTVASTTYMIGPLYSACIMSILTAHEFGHYFAAKYHRVPATLPYFIPFPSYFGTLGAVIRMSPAIPSRRALFDIAAAGPIAGLVVAFPVSVVGVFLSNQVQAQPSQATIMLGDPLIFRALQWLFFGPTPEGTDLFLHPIAFAGWVGLFVTALNLLPISQLDGGHINYALFGRRSRAVSLVAFVGLGAVTIFYGYQYTLILVLLWFMGIAHPPTLNDAVELGPTRRRIGVFLWIVFILCFSPAPFKF